jgi:hypothetical protein
MGPEHKDWHEDDHCTQYEPERDSEPESFYFFSFSHKSLSKQNGYQTLFRCGITNVASQAFTFQGRGNLLYYDLIGQCSDS